MTSININAIGGPSAYKRRGKPMKGAKRGRGIIDFAILVTINRYLYAQMSVSRL